MVNSRLVILLFFFLFSSITAKSQYIDTFEYNGFKKIEKMRKKRFKDGYNPYFNNKKVKRRRNKKIKTFYKKQK